MNHYEYPLTVRPLSQEDGGGFLVEVPDYQAVWQMAIQLRRLYMTLILQFIAHKILNNHLLNL